MNVVAHITDAKQGRIWPAAETESAALIKECSEIKYGRCLCA